MIVHSGGSPGNLTLSSVLLTTQSRCIDCQLFGWVYVGLFAFGMGTTEANFQLLGWRLERRTEVKILPRQLGWTWWRIFKSVALIWSGPAAEEGGARGSAEETSRGRIRGMSGEAIGRRLRAGPVRWWSAKHLAIGEWPEYTWPSNDRVGTGRLMVDFLLNQ